MYYHTQRSLDGNTYVNNRKEKGPVIIIDNDRFDGNTSVSCKEKR